jgi:PilZ domain
MTTDAEQTGTQDFFDLKKMPDHSKQDTVVALERRHFPRYSITASAEATDVKSQTRIKARISDLGRWGCHVDTVSPFVVNTVVKIGIEKDKERFFAEARVLYSTVGMGMGLIFTVVDPAEVSILEKWIADLGGDRSHPETTTQKTVENHASESSLHELRGVLNDIIATLIRKGILTDGEGNTMLQRLSQPGCAPP